MEAVKQVRLYAVVLRGAQPVRKGAKKVTLFEEGNPPASGDLSVETDIELICGTQEQMIAAYPPPVIHSRVRGRRGRED